MIIDVHGHYTTAPKTLEDWRNRQIAGIKDPAVRPKASELKISDEELRESIINNQLKQMKERGSDLAGGGARFTRLRAVMSAEGNEVTRRIIAQTFDDTSHAFIDAIHESLPQIPRAEIVWRSHFLLGALYYTLVTPERVSRLSRGDSDGADAGDAIEQLVQATVASLQAPALDRPAASRRRSATPIKAPADDGQALG